MPTTHGPRQLDNPSAAVLRPTNTISCPGTLVLSPPYDHTSFYKPFADIHTDIVYYLSTADENVVGIAMLYHGDSAVWKRVTEFLSSRLK